MKRLLITIAIALLAGAAIAQPRRHAVAVPPDVAIPNAYSIPVDGPWLVEVIPTGGFTGSPGGGVRVESNGTLTIGQLSQSIGKTCTFKLTATEIDEVATLVRALRTDLWFSSYVPANENSRCCDMIVTKVRVKREEQVPSEPSSRQVAYSTEFLLLDLPYIPRDLIAVTRLLTDRSNPDSIISKYEPACR